MNPPPGSARNNTALAMSSVRPIRGTSAGQTSFAALRSISSHVDPHPLAGASDSSHAAQALRHGESRADGICRDTGTAQLDGEADRERHHCGLGALVVGNRRDRVVDDRTRGLDDATPAALDHRRSDGLGHRHRREHVGAIRVLPILRSGLEPSGSAVTGCSSAGVVDEDVDRAVRQRLLGDAASGRRVVQRPDDRHHVRALVAQLLRNARQLLDVSAVQHDRRTGAGEPAGSLGSDSRARSGDERSASSQGSTHDASPRPGNVEESVDLGVGVGASPRPKP